MASQLEFSLEQYAESARTYRADLLRLPVLALASALAYMQLRPGIRFEEVVGQTSVDVELQPYKRNAKQDANLKLKLRVLRTYFGTVNADFDPNAAISTLMGHRAALASGDGLAQTPQAHEVLALVPKVIGAKLLRSLFLARHNPDGKTTMDLFDGFDTITEKEMAAGNIAASEGNYVKLSQAPDHMNALDVTREILDNMSPELRDQDCILFCSQKFADDYNRAYKLETGAVIYNQQFDQQFVEGSMGRIRIVPFAGKAGSKFIHVCPASNMLVGVDQMSDQENIRVKDYEPDTITVMLRMFFGTQFESIDPRRLLVAEIPETVTDPAPEAE